MAEAIGIVYCILSLIILAMGIVGYTRIKSVPSLLTGIAFGLLAIYHLLMLLGFAKTLWGLLFLVNIAAFVLVMVALYMLMDKKRQKS